MKIPGISPAETQHLSYEDTTVIYTCLITRLHNEVLKYDENKRLKIGTKTKLDPIWSLFRFLIVCFHHISEPRYVTLLSDMCI